MMTKCSCMVHILRVKLQCKTLNKGKCMFTDSKTPCKATFRPVKYLDLNSWLDPTSAPCQPYGLHPTDQVAKQQRQHLNVRPVSLQSLLLSLPFFRSLSPFTRISSVGLWTMSLEGGNASGYLSPSSSRSNQLVFQWAYLAPPAWHYLLQACLPGIAGPELLSCFSFSLLSSPLHYWWSAHWAGAWVKMGLLSADGRVRGGPT